MCTCFNNWGRLLYFPVSSMETLGTLHSTGGHNFYTYWHHWSHFVYDVVPVKNICAINVSAGESLFTSLHNLRNLCNQWHRWRYLYNSYHPWRHFLQTMATLAIFCASNGTTGHIYTFHNISEDILFRAVATLAIYCALHGHQWRYFIQLISSLETFFSLYGTGGNILITSGH